MRVTSFLALLLATFTISTSFLSDISTSPELDLKGPCECEEGWNFVVHQITPQGCREKSIYCSQGVELEPGYSCGTCPKPCSTCEEDSNGNVSICRVFNNGRVANYKASCNILQNFFQENGDFKNKNDHCGPCTCADENDKDSDGDGVCDKKDACPTDPNKSEADSCGCNEQDRDEDGVCDEIDECPDNPNRSDSGICGCDDLDSDGDGVCDSIDECPEDPQKTESGICGCEDMDSDGDGVCDSIDECPDNSDKSESDICGCDENDSDRDGICDELDVCDVSGSNRYEWIESISINNFTNTSGPNDNGYGFYGHEAITVASNDLLSVWINVGHTDAICELSYAIFIDWNKDTDFKDQGEMIFNERNTGETGINYQLSDGIASGKYVMRVMVDLGRIYGACGGCIDGESEDYVINITDNSCINAYEGFDYQKDSEFSNQSGGKSWSDGWNVLASGDVKATVLTASIQNDLVESNGNKLGVLNSPESKLNISRNLSDEIFKKSGDVWLSFSYKYDDHGIFAPKINGGSIGFYVDSKGYVVIGGLKGLKLNSGESYTFLVRANLNVGVDEITLWINPADRGADFLQTYNTPIDGNLANIGFEFKNSGTEDKMTAQYLDEIRVACSQEEVLPNVDSDLIQSNNEIEKLKIYPNPMLKGASVVVSLNGTTVLVHEFIIFDSSGRRMHSGILYNGENELQLPELESGVYFIELKTENATLRERLVIQNR